MLGQPGHKTRPHALFPPSVPGMGAWMTSQLNVALIGKLRGSLKCLYYLFDILSMGDCTRKHWQTSGRLVQELNACTVALDLQDALYIVQPSADDVESSIIIFILVRYILKVYAGISLRCQGYSV